MSASLVAASLMDRILCKIRFDISLVSQFSCDPSLPSNQLGTPRSLLFQRRPEYDDVPSLISSSSSMALPSSVFVFSLGRPVLYVDEGEVGEMAMVALGDAEVSAPVEGRR